MAWRQKRFTLVSFGDWGGCFVVAVQGVSLSLSSPFIRLLLVCPGFGFVNGLSGLSARFLLVSQGKGRGLGYEALVGRRFLLSVIARTFGGDGDFSGWCYPRCMARHCVACDSFPGFEHDLRQKIIGAHAHILVQHPQVEPFEMSPALANGIAQTDGVHASAPYVEVAVASRSNFNGGVLMGIDLKSFSGVLKVLESLPAEAVERLYSATQESEIADPFCFFGAGKTSWNYRWGGNGSRP